MKASWADRLLHLSQDPVVFHLCWIVLGLLFHLGSGVRPENGLPAFIWVPGLIIPFLALPAVWIKLWSFAEDGNKVPYTLGHFLIWIFQLCLAIELFILSYSTMSGGTEEEVPVAPALILTALGLGTLWAAAVGENYRISRGFRISANIILSFFAILSTKTFGEAMFSDPSLRIHFGHDEGGEIFWGVFIAVFLWLIMYLPLRYLFLRENFSNRSGFRAKAVFWITLIASMVVDLSGLIRW